MVNIILSNYFHHYVVSMVYRKNFEYADRRVGTVPSDNSVVPFFNVSMIIRIPIQPLRLIIRNYVSRYQFI